MQVKSIAECSKESILQYLRPSFSYHLSLLIFVLSIFEWLFYTGFTLYGSVNVVEGLCISIDVIAGKVNCIDQLYCCPILKELSLPFKKSHGGGNI